MHFAHNIEVTHAKTLIIAPVYIHGLDARFEDDGDHLGPARRCAARTDTDPIS